MKVFYFLIGLVGATLLSLESPRAETITQEIKTELAERAALIQAIENRILRNKATLNTLRKKLVEIEKTRRTQNKRQKAANSTLFRLIRRPDNMPLVAGLDLVRGEKLITNIQHQNIQRLNQLAKRNASIAQLTSDIESQQKALVAELKKRRTAHQELEALLTQKKQKASKKEHKPNAGAPFAQKTKNASALISAVIAKELGKKYIDSKAAKTRGRAGAKGQNFLLPPAAGKVIGSFGEKNAVGIHALSISLATLPSARVIAPLGGLVIFAGNFRSYGKTIILTCPGGYHILLAGLVRLDVEVGDILVASEPLGLMPYRPEPVLYFELRHLGRPINPEPLLIREEKQ